MATDNKKEHRVMFDFEVTFLNGGSLHGKDFRLDIDGAGISDRDLATYVVDDMRLLMDANVTILRKTIIEEPHKRSGGGSSTTRTLDDNSHAGSTASRTLFENNRVRVLALRLAPGQGEPMHSHPQFLVYVLNGSRMRMTSPAGEVKDVDLQRGQLIWGEPLSHAGENIGTAELHELIIELKPIDG